MQGERQSSDWTLVIRPDGTGFFRGIDTGRISIVEVMPGKNPPSILVKESGTKYFVSRGEQGYGGAQYRAFQVIGQAVRATSGIEMTVREVISGPVRVSQEHFDDVLARLGRMARG